MTPNERDLRTFLDDESEQVDVTGSFTEAVLAAKRRSDRRRLIAGAVAVLVAVVVAVPLLWSKPAGRGSQVPATTGVTESSVSSATPRPAVTTTARLEDAGAVGSPALSARAPFVDPGVPYAVSGTFHDGTAAPVEGPVAGGFPTFQRLDHGGFLAQAESGSDQRAYIVFTDGTSTAIPGNVTSVVVSADRSRIAWHEQPTGSEPDNGVIHIADSHGRQLSTLKIHAGPTALVGDVLYAIKLAGYDYAGESLRIDLTTGRQTVIKGNIQDVDADRGLALAVATVPQEPGPPVCYSVVDVRSDPPVTRLSSCGDVLPEAFSPDGRFLVAGFGSVVVDVATGQVVLDALGRSGLNAMSGRMTDNGSALVMAVASPDYSRTGLVRCTLDGSCMQVGGPSVAEPAPDDIDNPRDAYGVSEN